MRKSAAERVRLELIKSTRPIHSRDIAKKLDMSTIAVGRYLSYLCDEGIAEKTRLNDSEHALVWRYIGGPQSKKAEEQDV